MSTHYEAIIIGTGFAGIGMAQALLAEGISNFVLLEKQHDVGGVWRENSYPGAACDVPSHLYSFSFEPKPDWTHRYARQGEILAYLQHCAHKYGATERTRFGAEVKRADYDEATRQWTVELSTGQHLSARLLISAVGQLSRPALPALPGMESFAGPSFHSATWRHDVDLRGKRVGVIGTGASAVQFVPTIAPDVAKLSLFQRSAPYLLPRMDRRYPAWEQALYRRLPWLQALSRARLWVFYDLRAIAFTRWTSLMRVAGLLPFRMLLKKQVADPALRVRLTPDYPIGCKRLLVSSNYLPALTRPNVELVTERIEAVVPEGVRTADGRVHACDALIFGTGFAATEFLAPMEIRGSGGHSLNEVWAGKPGAYLGISVAGFPNFFMLYGPNTNLGHNSIVYMIESQVRHVMRCVREMRGSGASRVEVRSDAVKTSVDEVQQGLKHTVWQGCKSWYLNESGYNPTNWHSFCFSYRWQALREKLGSVYEFQR